MTSTFALLRRSRIALTLALQATVAQFGLALAGNTHQARLLAQGGAALGEICTVAGIARPAPAGDRAADPPRSTRDHGQLVRQTAHHARPHPSNHGSIIVVHHGLAGNLAVDPRSDKRRRPTRGPPTGLVSTRTVWYDEQQR